MSRLHLLNTRLHKLINIIHKIQFKKVGYRYQLVDVKAESDSSISLFILVTGIKKQIIPYQPDEIVSDDELLSGFSPCDVRAITYLSFLKYFHSEMSSLKIAGQVIQKGTTVFNILDISTQNEKKFYAKTLYQDYDLLTQLSKKDMISVISTAVQEQTILDIQKMDKIWV